MSDNPAEPHCENTEAIKLKSLWGIKPEIYLPGLYLLIIALILFFICFFPGIVSFGSYVHFQSNPDKSGIWINGKYAGSTGTNIFIPAGTVRIEIKKPYFSTVSFDEQISGRVFLSMFFPATKTIKMSLPLEDPDGLIRAAAADFSKYGMISSFKKNYQLPPILSDTMAVIYSRHKNSSPLKKNLIQFLKTALLSIDSASELRDYIKSFAMINTHGALFTPASVLGMIRDINHARKVNPNLPYFFLYWKNSGMPIQAIAERIQNSEWFSTYHANYVKSLENHFSKDEKDIHSETRILNGISFHRIPSVPFISGDLNSIRGDVSLLSSRLFPHRIDLNSFYISENEISNSQFNRFIRENPEWAVEKRQVLQSKSLVDGQYLADWEDPDFLLVNPNLPVVNVSYFAANAFCEWFSGKIKQNNPGLNARLPMDYELEYLLGTCSQKVRESSAMAFPQDQGPHKTGFSLPNAFGVRDLYGNVWEWCENWYFPCEYFFSNIWYTGNEITGAEKCLKGGSWINQNSEVSSQTRASQPPDWCTPYTGFRVVIWEQQNG